MSSKTRTIQSKDFRAIRTSIIERDGNKCRKCGLWYSLEVHHIEGYRVNVPEMLITLCYFCHGLAPMGAGEFAEWMKTGQSGMDCLRERLARIGMRRMSTGEILAVCTVLKELHLDFRNGQLGQAKARLRKSGVRCDGRMPYGSRDGEAIILTRIMKMRSEQKSSVKIARVLNAENVPTRYGKPWLASTVAKIIARNK